MPECKKYLRVGLIVRPHGVMGAVKLEPLSDSRERFKRLKDAYIERGGEYTPVTVSNVGVRDDAVYATLSGVETREDAQALRGAYLAVDRANAMRLPKGVYFVEDLIGCSVVTDAGETVGELTEVIETGANDVYIIEGKRRLLLPALKKVILSIDTQEGRIVLSAAALEEVGLFED